MHRTLLFGVAALALLSVPADARDGCGRGWFYNGVACAQEDGGYHPAYREPRYRDPGYGYRGGVLRRPALLPTASAQFLRQCRSPGERQQRGDFVQQPELHVAGRSL